MNHFIEELKRRNVLRVAGLYLAGTWLVVQVLGTVLPFFDAPLWIARTLTIVLAVGFVPAIVLAWVFEWTPQGLRRDAQAADGAAPSPQAGKRIDRLIMVVLALAIGYFAFDKFVLAPQRQAAVAHEARQEGRSEAIVAAYGDHSIAVLPFADMSAARDQHYLSDGIAEELLNLLARVPQLRVISRTSAFSFRDRKVDIPTIARKLDVGYILDGSIRKAGNRVRITVQLIDGRSDTQRWNDTYDRPLDDIFAIQDEIGAAVVAQLKIKLLGKELPKTAKTDPEAYELYLRSLAEYRRHTQDGYRTSGELALQALAIDPDYVDAWNMLAVVYIRKVALGQMPEAEGYAKAEEAARKALAINPRSAEAYAELANITSRSSANLASAAASMQRALELEPSNAYVLGQASLLAKGLGRVDLTVDILRTMLAQDPLMSNVHSELCQAYMEIGRLDEAISECQTALTLEPDRIIPHFLLSQALLLKGDPMQALEAARKEPFDVLQWLGESMALHSLGDRAGSDAALARAIAKYTKEAPYNIAGVEAWRGNADSAFAWLDKAVEYKDPGLSVIATDPFLARLRSDPRWLPFLRSQGKAPEQLAAIPFNVTLPVMESQRRVEPSAAHDE